MVNLWLAIVAPNFPDAVAVGLNFDLFWTKAVIPDGMVSASTMLEMAVVGLNVAVFGTIAVKGTVLVPTKLAPEYVSSVMVTCPDDESVMALASESGRVQM